MSRAHAICGITKLIYIVRVSIEARFFESTVQQQIGKFAHDQKRNQAPRFYDEGKQFEFCCFGCGCDLHHFWLRQLTLPLPEILAIQTLLHGSTVFALNPWLVARYIVLLPFRASARRPA